MEMNYSNEYVLKNTLFNDILIKYGLKNTVVLDEFRIDNSIADNVLLNGEAQIFEIKTSYDDLSKLPKQISDYQKFAEKVWIVSTAVHERSLKQMLKDTSVGIKIHNERGSFTDVKEADYNTRFFCHDTLFKTLHKKEYLDIVSDNFGFQPDVPNTKIFRECFAMVKTLEVKEFQQKVIYKLKTRSAIREDLITSDAIPESLKYLCYTYKINNRQFEQLNRFLNQSASKCITPTCVENNLS